MKVFSDDNFARVKSIMGNATEIITCGMRFVNLLAAFAGEVFAFDGKVCVYGSVKSGDTDGLDN